MSAAPKLNARQEAFCRGVAGGKAASQAYVDAGYTARNNSAETSAARLIRNVQVATRVRELQARAARKVEKTVADIIADLDRLRDEAFATGQLSAGVQAVMGAAKILGLIIDRSEAHVIQHKPALFMTAALEMSTEEWEQSFSPKKPLPPPTNGEGT